MQLRDDDYWNHSSGSATPTYRSHYHRQVAEREEEFVVEHLLPGKTRILEVGPGSGRLTRHLDQLAEHLTVCDVSRENLDFLAKRFSESTSIRYENLAIEALSQVVNYGRYDATVAMRVIPYVENWTNGLRSLRDATKKNGQFFFDLWCSQSFEYRVFRGFLEDEPVPAHRLTHVEIREGVESLGCEIVDTYRWGYPRLGAFHLDLFGALMFPRYAYSTTFCCRVV